MSDEYKGEGVHHRNQEGANALEFALVLPILIVVLFGAITFGLAFNAKMQLSHATRESVRYAATLPVPDSGMDDWYKDIVSRATATSAGQARFTDPELFLCVALIPESGTIDSMTMQGNTAYTDSDDLVDNGTSGTTSCFTDGLTDDRVQVRISRGTELSAVFFTKSLFLTEQAVSRFEAGG